MSMHIYIPTYRRATERHIRSGPLMDLGEEVMRRFGVTLMVRDDERTQYAEAMPDLHIDPFIATVSEPGIAASRLACARHAQQNGRRKFMMLDDDIRFLIRKGDDVWNLREPTRDEVYEMLEAVESQLDFYSHVGVSGREGNNRVGVGDRFELTAENTRTMRAVGFRTEDFLSVEHGRVDVMEDFDVSLQLLRAGGGNCCLYYWAQGQKQTNSDGGCSEWRTHEVHERSAHRLAELHPGYVRLRQKQNKTDREGFGTRTEVTISWKKAAKDGEKDA